MTRPSLRDESRALPSADIDWERHAARARRQQQSSADETSNYRGDDYLQRVAEEDPWPVATEEGSRGAQILSVHITTPPQELKSHHPADVNVKVRILREEYRKKIDLHLQSKPAANENATWARTSHDSVLLPTGLAGGSETELSTILKLVGQRVEVGDVQEYRAVATHPESSEEFISETVQAVFTLPVRVVEVPDMLFNHGGRLPCLDANDYLVGALATALLYARDEASQSHGGALGTKYAEELVVFGHTDTSDSDEVNYAVSEQRAQAVKSLLNADVESWRGLAAAHGRVADYQSFLKALTQRHGWSCDPGSVDGKVGPKTQAGLKAFQQQANARYQLGLTEDGIIGPKAWGAVHRVLCGLVAKAMGTEDPAVPQYPKWILPTYGYAQGQGCYGCGESFPIEKKDHDNYRSQTNRRVELVFFPVTYFRFEAPADSTKPLDKEKWPLRPREGIKRHSLTTELLPWDNITISDSIWDFFQENMPHKDNAEEFHAMLQGVYGNEIDRSASDALRRDFSGMAVPAPDIQVLTTMKPEQLGAYLESTIYLNRQLVVDANANPISRWLLLMVMVHEVGHHLDDLLRKHYSNLGGDADGDEGAIFADYYLTHSSQELLNCDLIFGAIIYSHNKQTTIQTLEISQSQLDGGSREQRYWSYRGELGKDKGTLNIGNGTTREVEFWSLIGINAGVLKLRIPVDPAQASSDDDRFRLYSAGDSPAYNVTLSIKDDKKSDDKFLDLEFTKLNEELSYTLEIDPGSEGIVYKLFENILYKDLVAESKKGSDVLQKGHYDDVAVKRYPSRKAEGDMYISGNRIEALQMALKDVGFTEIGQADGDFGKKTVDCLEKFQAAAQGTARLIATGLTNVAVTFTGQKNGFFDEATNKEIKLWIENEYKKAGPNSLSENPEDYIDKHINEICENEYHNPEHNHCAHFVSHVKNYSFGYTCRSISTNKNADGANIRVHEVFKECPSVGAWADKPSELTDCLTFVIDGASNVSVPTKTMQNVPRKHIGILKGGEIYHYSNSKNKVVKQAPDAFAKHYGSDSAVFYGTFPT